MNATMLLLLVVLAAAFVAVAEASPCQDNSDATFSGKKGKVKPLCEWLKGQKTNKRKKYCKKSTKQKYLDRFGTDVALTCCATCEEFIDPPTCPDQSKISDGGSCDAPGLSGCPGGTFTKLGCRSDAPICRDGDPSDDPSGCAEYDPFYCAPTLPSCECVDEGGKSPVWRCAVIGVEACLNPSPDDCTYEQQGGDALFGDFNQYQCDSHGMIEFVPNDDAPAPQPSCPCDRSVVNDGEACYTPSLFGCPGEKFILQGCRNDAPICNGRDPPSGCGNFDPFYCTPLQSCDCTSNGGQEGGELTWTCAVMGAEQCLTPSPKDETYQDEGGDALFGLPTPTCDSNGVVTYPAPTCPDQREVSDGEICDAPGLSGCPGGPYIKLGCRNDNPTICNGTDAPSGCEDYDPFFCAASLPSCECVDEGGKSPTWQCASLSVEQCTNPSPRDDTYEDEGGDALFGPPTTTCDSNGNVVHLS